MENNITSNQQIHHPPICANQNLMHVKFHVNKFQDNLLSKRLKQLNNEEMKTRLKHQRTSNELIYFLRECQKSTGYYSKMNEYKTGSKISTEESALEKCISFCPSSSIAKTTNKIRPSTGKFRSISYSNSFPNMKNSSEMIGDQKFAVRSIDESSSHRASLFIDTLSTSTPNTPNSSSNASSSIANISKTSTSRSSNNSSAFSSNSSESFAIESANRDFKLAEKSLTTRTVSIIRPQTAQLSKKILFTKVPPPQILTSKKSSLTDSTTISNIDWLYSNHLGFDQEEFFFNSVSSSKNNNNSILSASNSSNFTDKNVAKKHLSSETAKLNNFKSKSMNFSTNQSKVKYSSTNSQSVDNTSINKLNTDKNEINSIDMSSLISKDQPSIKVRKVVINSRNLPIKINMSRSSIRKRQIEIMDEYNRYNSIELLNNLRQIQKNLDTKVKQFANNNDNKDNNTNNNNNNNANKLELNAKA